MGLPCVCSGDGHMLMAMLEVSGVMHVYECVLFLHGCRCMRVHPHIYIFSMSGGKVQVIHFSSKQIHLSLPFIQFIF